MKYKGVLGYVLILSLVISNVFNYNTSAKYRTEFKVVTETISTVDNKIELIEILISYIDIETNEKLEDDELITKQVGEEVIGENFKKDIIGYRFEKTEPGKIIVSEEIKEIKLYYKKDEVIPDEKYVDVTIHHYLIDSTEKLVEDEVLKDIEIGTSLDTAKYLKQIGGYDFKYLFPEFLEVRKDNSVIRLYYEKKDIIPLVEYVDVTVNYFIENTTTSIIDCQVLKNVKIGSILLSKKYIKTIKGYEFYKTSVESLEVSKENNIINIYYKKLEDTKPIETEKPESNNKPGGDKGDSGSNGDNTELGKEEELPETGRLNILWLGYVLVLLGLIIRSSKKEEYTE